MITALDRLHISATTDDGRGVELHAPSIARAHLTYGYGYGYGYATTVYRSQGATHERVHMLADSGGREFAYIALSRSRDRSDIHVIAGDSVQGLADLCTDWSIECGERWIASSNGIHGLDPAPDPRRAERLLPDAGLL
jgi:hypothetical protein